MQLKKIMDAYRACLALSEKEMDFGSAHRLLLLRQELEIHVRFFSEQEQKLVEKYGKKQEDGTVLSADGRFSFASEKDKNLYLAAWQELAQTETDIRWKRCFCHPPERLSASQLLALEPFVDFADSENGKKRKKKKGGDA